MKKLFSLSLVLAAVFCLASCGGLEEEFMDNSYVYIADGSGESSTIVKNDKMYNPHTLWVTLSLAKTDLDATVEVYYEAIADGLREGVDYTINTESASPLKFKPGNFVVPLRIKWLYESSNEGTLTIKLTGSNLSYLQMGYAKTKASSTYVYTKKASGN